MSVPYHGPSNGSCTVASADTVKYRNWRWVARFVWVWYVTSRLKILRRTKGWSDAQYYQETFSIPSQGPGHSVDKFASTRAALTGEIDQDKACARVLDLATGFAFQARHMYEHGYRNVYACDLVPYRLSRARALHGRNGIRYLTADMQTLCMPVGALDAITISVGLHDLPVAAVETTLQECHRALGPGGRLVFMEPRYVEDVSRRWFRWFYRWCCSVADESPYVGEYMKFDVAACMARIGFRPVRRQNVWGRILCIYTFEKTGGQEVAAG